ncbi:MAG: cadmium-translocating P-type ATPase [Ruminococcaceae bacterium]|nr:cadmium-translocating P-type ATPase [Oscillospiraceae bacterium]
MNRKQKRILLRVIVSAFLLITALVLTKIGVHEIISSSLCLCAFITVGYDVIIKAAWGIRNRNLIDENLLMTIASVGAVCLAEFFEAVAIMLFYQVGELFQSYAVNKSRKSIEKISNIRPDAARVIRDEKELTVSPEEVEIGEIIRVFAGEKIALDGEIIEGETFVNNSFLTGESIPVGAGVGDSVYAGSINMEGTVKVKVTAPFSKSSVAKILELTETSYENKSKSERFITKFARYYTPLVVVAALLIAIIPQFFINDGRGEWVRRALTFLVISCPCALLISVPLSFFGGVGSASSNGILIKGSGILEKLSKCDTVVFDKTGTLTKGEFAVTEIKAEKINERVLLAVCAAAESQSNHPIAKCIVKASNEDYKRFKVEMVREIVGKGVIAKVEKWQIAAGNIKLMEELGVTVPDTDKTVIYVTIDGKYAGFITVGDTVKGEANEAIELLKELDNEKIIMLTGDREENAKSVAESLLIDEYFSNLLPENKVSILENVIEKAEGSVAFVGDGINDAPVIARADVGFSMGNLGSDAAVETADVVITDDDLRKIPLSIKIAKRTTEIATQNIILAISVKILFLMLGIFGASGMAGAVFADVGIAVITILNAMRTLSKHE